jgi:CheY-like chemotaxis protein
MERKRIALIDDDLDVLTYLAFALEDHGFEALPASDSEKGLEMIRAAVPDLICLDLLMPRRTGLALYRALREDPRLRAIPVVILTGLSLPGALEEILAPPGEGRKIPPPQAVIEKPVQLSSFLETVRALTAAAPVESHV